MCKCTTAMCGWYSPIVTEWSFPELPIGIIYRSLPAGLAKKGKIPPGHARKMQRYQSVPPDAAWRYLPSDVERRLSRLPDGYARIVIGADVAIMNTRTRVVVDLLEDLHD